MKSKRAVFLMILITATILSQTSRADELEQGFRNTPDAAKPRTWWHWLNGNITKEGITADLEAMKRVGIGGAQIVDGDLGITQVVAKTAMYMTPEWLEMLRHAASESERLGLELTLANCAGWSESGGPWVKPEEAMQKLVWSEMRITGPRKQPLNLAQPPDVFGPFQSLAVKPHGKDAEPETRRYYADSAIVAFRLGKELPPAKVTANAKPQAVLFEYPEPVTCRSVTVLASSPLWELQASDDRKNFRPVTKFSGPRSQRSRETPKTISFPETRARFFRLLVKDPKPVTIESVELSGEVLLNRWEDKAGFALLRDYSEVPAVEVTGAVSNVVNLTGQTEWDVPAGEWMILRLGHSPTGKKNHPAVPEGTGLECDKMSRAAVEVHFNTVLDKIMPVVGNKLKGILIDSWEADHQNWTPAFPAEFQKHRGYDPLPYLPAMTGRVVESAEVTERFLWDVRRTIADLIAEHHYGTFQELCTRRGLTLYAEASGTGIPTFADQLQCKGRVDIPMGEFWNANVPYAPIQLHHIPDCKEAASAAHIYGKPLAAAEAFTSGGRHAPWGYPPFAEKALGDRMFCAGINRFVFHTYAHQPLFDRAPGLTMGPYGIDFGRTLTWWDHGAAAWMSYLSRCQFMLQQGLFVADACYFYGEDVPATVGDPTKLNPALPAGYDYDVCNAEVLLTRMAVKNGRIVLANGLSYRVLVLPASDRMTPVVLRKIQELVKAGATVVGPTKPVKSPSLTGSDAEVQQLADALPIWGKPLAFDVPPDFDAGGADLTFIHRSTGSAEIYFVSNQKYQETNAICTFRVAGKAPELWWPDTGKIEPAPFTVEDGRTRIPLHFDPAGSLFVVFRKPGTSAPVIKPASKEIAIAGPWQVNFGGTSVAFAELTDWTKNAEPDIKFFSGTATYAVEFEIADVKPAIHLDLGNVKEIAEVTLNGQALGTLWKPPFSVDITRAAKPGKNQLEVQVTNLWPNRLIGDLNQPADKRQTWSVITPFKKDSPLLASGLLGPVRLMVEETK